MKRDNEMNVKMMCDRKKVFSRAWGIYRDKNYIFTLELQATFSSNPSRKIAYCLRKAWEEEINRKCKEIFLNKLKFVKGVGYQVVRESIKRSEFTKENFENSKLLENFISSGYEKDKEVFQLCRQYTLTAKTYKALIYIVEDDTQEWTQSPYSLSFYNSDDIDWGYKPEKSLRVSDHWNFGDDNEHCQTIDGKFKRGWAIGVYENGKYRITHKF